MMSLVATAATIGTVGEPATVSPDSAQIKINVGSPNVLFIGPHVKGQLCGAARYTKFLIDTANGQQQYVYFCKEMIDQYDVLNISAGANLGEHCMIFADGQHYVAFHAIVTTTDRVHVHLRQPAYRSSQNVLQPGVHSWEFNIVASRGRLESHMALWVGNNTVELETRLLAVSGN